MELRNTYCNNTIENLRRYRDAGIVTPTEEEWNISFSKYKYLAAFISSEYSATSENPDQYYTWFTDELKAILEKCKLIPDSETEELKKLISEMKGESRETLIQAKINEFEGITTTAECISNPAVSLFSKFVKVEDSYIKLEEIVGFGYDAKDCDYKVVMKNGVVITIQLFNHGTKTKRDVALSFDNIIIGDLKNEQITS